MSFALKALRLVCLFLNHVVLISKNKNPRAPRAMDNNVQGNSYDKKPNSVEIICNYCRKQGLMKRDCRKLLYKNSQQSQHAQIASICDTPKASVTISAIEFAKFQNYRDSLQASSSVTAHKILGIAFHISSELVIFIDRVVVSNTLHHQF